MLIHRFTDGRLDLLRHLRLSRVSHLPIRQKITIQPSHTHPCFLLGTRLHVLWFCPELCRSSCH